MFVARLSRRLIGAVLALAAAVMVTAGSAQAKLPAAVAAKLDHRLAAVMTPPRFAGAGGPIDPAALKGKLIFTIPLSTAIPFCAVVDRQLGVDAKRLGLRSEIWQNSAQLAQWAQGFTAAGQHKAALVNVFCGLDPNAVAPQVRAALAAHTPVVAAHSYAQGQPQFPGLSGVVYGAYIPAARLEADWVIRQTQGAADALVITAPGVANSPFIQKAIAGQFRKYCPTCKVRFLGVNPPDWATKIGPQVQSAILADPKLNYIIPIYDGMVQFVMPPIIATGAGARVKIASFNATPAVLDMMRTGNVVTFDVGEDPIWLAGAILDQDMRVLLHKPLVADDMAGLRAFTKADVAAAGVPAKFATGYGTAAAAGYAKLWGLH